jgi:hypothetical protein
VSEPERGRVLLETSDLGGTMTYTLTPVDCGAHTYVDTYVEMKSVTPSGMGIPGAVAWLFMILVTPFRPFIGHMVVDS